MKRKEVKRAKKFFDLPQPQRKPRQKKLDRSQLVKNLDTDFAGDFNKALDWLQEKIK